MRDINIGIEGVSSKVDSETFWVASEVPLQVLSSSVVGGDLQETSHILSVRVPADRSNGTTPFKDPGPSCGTEPRPWGLTDRLWD